MHQARAGSASIAGSLFWKGRIRALSSAHRPRKPEALCVLGGIGFVQARIEIFKAFATGLPRRHGATSMPAGPKIRHPSYLPGSFQFLESTRRNPSRERLCMAAQAGTATPGLRRPEAAHGGLRAALIPEFHVPEHFPPARQRPVCHGRPSLDPSTIGPIRFRPCSTSPSAWRLTQEGNVFVADTNNSLVRKFTVPAP
ncbi:hypothetical protein SAMN04488595_12729 [Ralstonia sp. 25mfcol4.1]|nr:hypothetical protein SAMN04488595_12729 [Ralstonia sp. 25mfcol4.1]